MNAFSHDEFSEMLASPAGEQVVIHTVAKGGTGFGHEAPVQGATNEWYTPPLIFTALGLQFDLDPCSPQGGLPWVPANRFYSLPDDGLALPWDDDDRIWCNPPYGPATKLWLKRMSEHRNGIALVFARTDTEWFHLYAKTADAILFIEGRLRFVDATGEAPVNSKGQKNTAGTGSMLVAWGDDCVTALKNCGLPGMLIDLRPNDADEFEGLLR